MNYQVVDTSMLHTNTYLIFNDDLKECICIDAGDKAEEIAKIVSDKGYSLKYILLTHLHFDHANGVKELKELTGAKVYIPKAEESFLHSFKNLAAGVGKIFKPFTPDVMLEGGEKLELCGFKIDVLLTPGHTVGSTTYIFDEEEVMFCGDTIFRDSYGRTDLPTGNFGDIMDSIKLLCSYKKDYLMLCGHGPSTTLSREKKNNGYE